jgi:dienelactone hydrolase
MATVGCTSPTDAIPERGHPTIGLRDVDWVDSSRVDPHYGDYRRLNVRIWYPAAHPGADSLLASYYPWLDLVDKASDYWSAEQVDRLRECHLSAYPGAPLLKQKAGFPVIVFSPSLGGHLSHYSHYAERLAHEGYVVLGMNHLYESAYVLDVAGSRFIPSNQMFHDSLKELSIPDEITADQYRLVKGDRQKVLGEDVVFALDQLAKTSFLQGRLDLEKVGAFGHSIGGAAIVYASLLDDRIGALINMDGTPPSVALDRGVDVPYLFLEDLTDYENHPGYILLHARRQGFCERNTAASWRILFAGFHHNSFLDQGYYLGLSPAEQSRAEDRLNWIYGYVSDFFNMALRQKDTFDYATSTSDSVHVFRFRGGN